MWKRISRSASPTCPSPDAMEKLRAKLLVSFSTKVIVSVVTVMVLLLVVTVWTVNDHLTRQFRAEAARNLGIAGVTFQRFQRIHAMNLLMRFRNLPNEPRYKAAFQAGDPPTLRDLLADLRGEQGLDVVAFTSDKPELRASSKGDPMISIGDFENATAFAITQALRGEDQPDTVRVGDRLFEIVAIPVFGTSDHLIGSLTLGSEIGNQAAQDLRDFNPDQIFLPANRAIMDSTLCGALPPDQR